MNPPAKAPERPATYADLEAVPEHLVAEIIDGELMTHSGGEFRPAATRSAICAALGPLRWRRDWTFVVKPELHLGRNVLVPDLSGWKRSRLAGFLDSAWSDVPLPDWICEVISGSTAKRDRTLKMRIYAEAGIPHMWLIDPRLQILEAFELHDGRWTKIGDWNSDDEVRAPPFDAISFSLADLWPLDQPLGFNEDPQALYAGDR